MIVKDLPAKSDEELMAMLNEIGHEPIEWTPVIVAELTRRAIKQLNEETQRLHASSRRLERLTIVLIALTIVLMLLAIPPAINVAKQWSSLPSAVRSGR